MEQHGATGAWSFKAVIAHLNGWRVRTLDRLDVAKTGAEPAPPPWPAGLNEDSEIGLTQINAWIEQAGRERLLEEVLGEARRLSGRSTPTFRNGPKKASGCASTTRCAEACGSRSRVGKTSRPRAV